jgi:hypothetical protein
MAPLLLFQTGGFGPLFRFHYMVAILPTRLIPGAILGAFFACIGIETGLLTSALLRSHTLLPTHWLCIPLFGLALLYVRRIWHHGRHQHPVRGITALSPRLQAVIFGSCLGMGLGTGAVIVFATLHGS